MKKIVLMVGGIVVVGAVVWMGRERAHEGNVGHASGLSSLESVHGADLGSTGSGGMEITASPQEESSQSAPSVDKPVVDLSSPVKALLGLDGQKHNYPSLLKVIGELGLGLSTADVAALMEMLAWPNDRFPEGMTQRGINAVKNDVLDKLMRQTTLPEGLGLQIAEMAANPDNDPVWREYCVQFMGPCYERLSTESILTTKGTKVTEGHEGKDSVNSVSSSAAGGEKNESDVIREALFSALDERGTEMAGTALIGLENLSRTHAEFDRALIASKAVSIASDGMASTESRMTALRLAAAGNLKPETGNLKLATADAARELAQTGETVLMRSAAIVTLGEVGSESDRELLESYAAADTKQIAAAAKMALSKMDDRVN